MDTFQIRNDRFVNILTSTTSTIVILFFDEISRTVTFEYFLFKVIKMILFYGYT